MKTATVETLTAEVRVLMVGNRQVTLTMYRQLDFDEDIHPWGRVKSGMYTKTGRPTVEVVGEDDLGRLVRCFAEMDVHDKRSHYDEWIELPLIVLAGLR